jgi:tetratricopeptide (TPR) repeat protein
MLLVLAAVSLFSCGEDFQEDIDRLNNQYSDIEQRVSKLESQVTAYNSQLTQISALAKAVEQGFYITQVKTNGDSYELTFSDGNTLVLQKGANNTLTPAPAISMTQLNGFFYWTLNGMLLTNGGGQPIRTDGLTPIVKYDFISHQWIVSIDGGTTFKNINELTSIVINDGILLQIINNYIEQHRNTFISQDILYHIITTYIQRNYAELFNIKILDEVVVSYIDQHYTQIFDFQLLEKIFTQYNFEYITNQINVDKLINAIKQENDRNYTGAIAAWQEVLKYNNNFDTAYIGVGKALFREGSYEEAMEYFRAAYDEENYSNAYREVRTAWISDPLHLLLIPLVVVVFCLGLSRLLRFASKVNTAVAIRPNRKTTYWEELLYSFYVPFHPFDGFWDLKHEKRGSVRASLTIIGLVVVCFYYQSVGTGYIMNPDMVYSTFLTQVISVAVPILLWVVANWCLTTLFEGEGSFKDIIIAVGYAVAPMIFFLIMGTLLSNIVAIEEAALVTLLITIGYVWSGCLLFFGLMVTHDYRMGKNLLITICTIVGMAVIIFVALLFSGLLTKMVSFVSSIITEISYRL